MKRKRKLLCVLLCIFAMCVSAFPVSAAVSSYVSGNYGTKTVGQYQVKVNQNGLYSRKRYSGNWKKLASNCQTYTTNGSKIYFAKDNYNYSYDMGDAVIYSSSIKGGKKTRVATLHSRAVEGLYCYKDKLYVQERRGKHGDSIGVYSLKTYKYRILQSGILLEAYGGYGITTNSTYKWTYPLYSTNLSSRKRKKITSYCWGSKQSGKYLYFASFTKNTRAYQNPGTFVVRRVSISGSGNKVLTRRLYGMVSNVTSKYVEYERNGVTRRVYY